MASDNELLIKINGSAKNFTDEIDRVNKKTQSLQAGLSKIAKVSAVAFAALAGAVGATVIRFKAFEKSFSNVQTLLDKSSFSTKTLAEGTEDLRKGILALGAQSGESFENLNKGLFDLVSAGVSADKAISTLAAATKLAIAGATDTSTAVKALTSSMTSFGKAAGTADDISEKFFTAQKFGVTTVGELATEFNKVAGTANALGLSFDESLASLSALTADGAKPTALAATQLKAVMNSLILVQAKLKNESAGVQDALSLQNIKQRGLVASLQLLKTATGGSISEMNRLLGSSESLQVALSLAGPQAGLVAKQIEAIGNASERSAVFQEALALKQETLDQATKRLGTSLDAASVTFGQLFAPSIISAADAVTAIAVKFSELDKDTLETLATFTKFALGITAITTVLATLGLAYIKIKGAAILLNTTFGLSSKAVKLYNFTLIAGKKAASLFAAGMRIATGSVRGFAAATGIGLVLVVLSFLITDFKKTVAVGMGSFSALGAGIMQFATNVKNILGNIGELFISIFSFDKDKIAENLEALKSSLMEGFTGIGTAAAEAYSTAYNQYIAEDEEVKKEAEVEKKAEELEQVADHAEAKAAVVIAGKKKADDFKAKSDAVVKKLGDKLNIDQIKAFEKNNNSIIALTGSKNKTMKEIGKKAAVVQAGIDTYRGSIAAYQALAGIPIVGPALGIAAGAAVAVYGAEKISRINSAAQGGVVPNGSGGARDRVHMMLEPGEAVVPKALTPNFIQQFGRPNGEVGSGGSDMNVTIGFTDEAFEIIEQKLIERRIEGVRLGVI